MKRNVQILALAAVVLCVGNVVVNRVRAEGDQAPSRAKSFMRKKLVASELVMEGLTTPDYSLIQRGATSMIHMSKEAMWDRHQTPSYAQDSADFVHLAERLVKQARAKDLEGASHTFGHLTVQCVSCHRRLRGQKVASAEMPYAELHARLSN